MLTIRTKTNESTRVTYQIRDGDRLIDEGWIGVWENSRRSGSPGMRGFRTAHQTAYREAQGVILRRFRKAMAYEWIREGQDWMNLA